MHKINFSKGIGHLLLLFITQIFCAIALAIPFNFFLFFEPNATDILILVSLPISYYLIFLLIKYLKKTNFKSLFKLHKYDFHHNIYLIFVPLFVLVNYYIDTLLLILFGTDNIFYENLETISSSGAISIFFIIIIAPIFEEIMFRGIILPDFLSIYSPFKSILYNSLLFSAFHLNLFQVFVGLSLGAITGFIYYKSKSVIPCIIFHMLYNIPFACF